MTTTYSLNFVKALHLFLVDVCIRPDLAQVDNLTRDFSKHILLLGILMVSCFWTRNSFNSKSHKSKKQNKTKQNKKRDNFDKNSTDLLQRGLKSLV